MKSKFFKILEIPQYSSIGIGWSEPMKRKFHKILNVILYSNIGIYCCKTME